MNNILKFLYLSVYFFLSYFTLKIVPVLFQLKVEAIVQRCSKMDVSGALKTFKKKVIAKNALKNYARA